MHLVHACMYYCMVIKLQIIDIRSVPRGISRASGTPGFYTILKTLNFRVPESGMYHGTRHILNFYLS